MATTTLNGIIGPHDRSNWTILMPETLADRSELVIGGGLRVRLKGLPPNRFHRWMHRVFFGFHWTAL